MNITHRFTSAKSDSTDTTLVNPSNWNAAHTISGMPFSDPADYDFTPYSPNVSLTGGIVQTISFVTVPTGINATNASHYLYISGGSGTAEAVLITGGTAVSGSTTLVTISFTPANSHSGAWTIRSATAGFMEAMYVNRRLLVGPGTFNFYAPFTPINGCTVEGAGSGTYTDGATVCVLKSATAHLFNVIKDNVRLANLTLIQDTGIPATSSIGLYVGGAGSGVTGEVSNWFLASNITLKAFYYGVYFNGSGGQSDINKIFVESCVSTGLVACGAQGFWSNITAEYCGTKQTTPVTKMDGGHGIYIRTCPGGSCAVPPWFSGIQTFSNYGYGFYADEVSCTISGAYSYFNNDRAGELYLSASGNLCNFTAENGGVPAGVFVGVPNTTAVGLEIGPVTSNLIISNGKINNNNGIGLLANGSNAQITGCQLFSNGLGLIAGSLYGVKVNAVTNLSFIDCRITDPILVTGATDTHFSHCIITGGTLTLPSLLFTATSLYSFVAQNWIQNTHSGAALQIDAASSILEGDNFVGGTLTNNGTLSLNSFSNCPSKKTRNFYVATESGANNALVILLPGITPSTGDLITISLAHSLQIGANTLSINAVSFNIKRMKSVASNLTAAYLSTSIFICVVNGTDVLDITQ